MATTGTSFLLVSQLSTREGSSLYVCLSDSDSSHVSSCTYQNKNVYETYTVQPLSGLSVSMFLVLADTQVLSEVDQVAASAS